MLRAAFRNRGSPLAMSGNISMEGNQLPYLKLNGFQPIKVTGASQMHEGFPHLQTKILGKKTNVLKTGPVIEPKKLPIHGSLVGLPVEPLSNR